MKTVFSPADILLPDFAPESAEWTPWAAIACDQFTGEPGYWENAEKIRAGKRSTLDYILPEAYLGTEKEQISSFNIKENMKNAAESMKVHENCMIFVERTLPDGKIRRGIVGKIDLEEYDFTPESASAVRATEKTVVERIPPRVAVRRAATVEFPHIMVFADDKETRFIEKLSDKKEGFEKLYSFELMLGGGRIDGWKISGEPLCELMNGISAYEASKNGVVYAVGDGNHSLASAKAHYEEVKKQTSDPENHPARYALAEIVSIFDSSIEFEPIYRILKNCDPADVLEKMAACDKGQGTVTAITAGGQKELPSPAGHPLTVGALQMFLDDYIAKNPQTVCDYIHGKETLVSLVNDENTLGFLFNGVEKEELFDYVTKNGTLPRKTFSMGEAKSKRYYLEARKIVL